jgi:hypothetical protein
MEDKMYSWTLTPQLSSPKYTTLFEKGSENPTFTFSGC